MRKIIKTMMMVVSLSIPLGWQGVWCEAKQPSAPAKADMQDGQGKNGKSTISTTSPTTSPKNMGAIGLKQGEISGVDKEKNINNLINNLDSDDHKIIKESREKLKAMGKNALNGLRKSAKTKNRKLRLNTISTYVDILIDQQKDPRNDKIVLDSISDEYYMVRINVLGILAMKGHKEFAEILSKKIAEPSEDDDRIFNDIIREMRIKLNKEWKMWNPAMFEEGYLVNMGEKINTLLENIISNENENIILRKRLLHAYRDINKKKGNKYLLKMLEKTQDMEIKREILSNLNSEWNKNDALLIKELKRILSQEKNIEIKEFYNLTISDLMKK